MEVRQILIQSLRFQTSFGEKIWYCMVGSSKGCIYQSLLDLLLRFNKSIMSERKPWTEEEDRILKFVFQATKVTKWSHIARRLQDQFGVKGRNGKQCKERYTTFIDPTYPKEEWSYEEEQRMFQLHNQLGNKWAIIGTKCGGKTDNSVKNHFYSRLRKALKKINQVILEKFRKQYKQLKPPLLYKIVEVSEERFKINSTFEKEFVFFSNQLKNELLNFSYDDEDDQQTQSIINVDMAKNLVEKVNEFGANYKKKTKKEKKSSGYENNLLTPRRYQIKGRRVNSQNEESQHNNSFVNSSDVGNSQDISDDQINRSTLNVNYNLAKLRRNSADNSAFQTIQVPKIRTRAKSNENIKKQAEKHEDLEMKDEKFEEHYRDQVELLQVEGVLEGLKILEEEQNLPPHPSMMNKEISRYSRYSQGTIQKEEYHFFEDSQMQMRILPEVQALRRDSQFEENIFR